MAPDASPDPEPIPGVGSRRPPIAAQVHDGPLQQAALLLMHAELLLVDVETGQTATLVEKLTQLRDEAAGLSGELRALIHELVQRGV